MNKPKLEIYALIVCAISLLFFIVPFSNGIYQVIRIARPGATIDTSTFDVMNSNDSYWDYAYRLKYGNNSKEFEKAKVRPSDAELDKGRAQLRSNELRKEVISANQKLINNIIESLVGLALFLIHWTLAKRVRKAQAEA